MLPSVPLTPVIWVHGCISSPPFSITARHEAGYQLFRLQLGELLSMPDSRPMPSIGARCHELRIRDGRISWRVVYRLDADAVLVLDVFGKTTRATPLHILRACRQRCARYDSTHTED
jgi:phage-related protein